MNVSKLLKTPGIALAASGMASQRSGLEEQLSWKQGVT
jgi:hypothetical protein